MLPLVLKGSSSVFHQYIISTLHHLNLAVVKAVEVYRLFLQTTLPAWMWICLIVLARKLRSEVTPEYSPPSPPSPLFLSLLF